MQQVEESKTNLLREALGYPAGHFTFTARDEEGNVKWEEKWMPNLVVDEGVNHALATELSAGTQVTTWYIGLKNTGAVAAGDTAAQIGGTNAWGENQDYSEANRQAWSEGGVSSKSIDNSGTPASFSINGSTTIDGAFLISDNTKGGVTGTLFAAADFGSQKSLNNGDTLEVTYTITGDDDGV